MLFYSHKRKTSAIYAEDAEMRKTKVTTENTCIISDFLEPLPMSCYYISDYFT